MCETMLVDLNSDQQDYHPQSSQCGKIEDIDSQFAPVTPDKLHDCALSHHDHSKSGTELPSSQEQEPCVEDPPLSENHKHETPRQMKPKRKKLRGRLVKEGQQENFPKSTPKHKYTTPASTEKTKKPKRKPPPNAASEIDGMKVKSSKRSLNFDSEGISLKRTKDTCGAPIPESSGQPEMAHSSTTDQMVDANIPLPEYPTRRELLRANLKVLAMLRDEQKAREKHGDRENKDQHQMRSSDFSTLLRKGPKKGETVYSSENNTENVSSNMENAIVLFKGDNRMVLHEEKKQLKLEYRMVIHKGVNYQMVLYEGNKPWRSRVALDSETTRAWNHLMAIEAGEGVEGTDADKEKWWEEERRVFRERVDLFIARMHIIQGNRRFSPWKGSIVDSVVGVFLTQNVSDHLSSSAFMTLAAYFPPKHMKRADLKVEKANWCHYKQSSTLLKLKENLAKAERDVDWDELRKEVYRKHGKRERSYDIMDSVDWEAVLRAEEGEVAFIIEKRGQHQIIAWKIQQFLKRLVEDHGSIDLEWLRDAPPHKAKEFLNSFYGLGPKSVDCISLLTLHHHAFPVDTNIQRIAVRLGWAPLQLLPEGIQLHDLEKYPEMKEIQTYLWPRLYTLDQDKLYELHYQMITFGKVFCGKVSPNCNACPMRKECKHFASVFASTASSIVPISSNQTPSVGFSPLPLPPPETDLISETINKRNVSEPIIEEPASPEFDFDDIQEHDIEDFGWQKDIEDNFYEDYEDPDEIPLIILNTNDYEVNSQNHMHANKDFQNGDMSMVLIPDDAYVPSQKLKNVKRLRTEHQVYLLPDNHHLLEKFEKIIPGDVCQYLLAILPATSGTTETNGLPQTCSDSQNPGNLCNDKESSSCRNLREANSETVKGVLLTPTRTTMRGFFPLNGTYFQVNEVFVDQESCLHPIDVPRDSIGHLERRTVYCSTSIPSLFKDMTTEEVQACFWNGFVCVRSFDQRTGLPDSLKSPMHHSGVATTKGKGTKSKPKGKSVVLK